MIYEFLVNNPVRLAIGNFLSTSIIDLPFIFIDFWSFVHLFAGMLIIYLFFKADLTEEFILLYLFLVLIFYEVAEIILYFNLTRLFIVESFVNFVWDLIIGFTGGFIFKKYYE